METLLMDVRYAARTLAKAPGYALVSILTLALGIGANSTIFSLINGMLLRPLPGIQKSDELVLIGQTWPTGPFANPDSFYTLSLPNLGDIRDRSHTLTVAAFGNRLISVSGRAEPQMLQAMLVTGNYFSVLGTRSELGRLLSDEDDREGAPPAAVIGYGLWQQWGGDTHIVGSTVRVDGRAVTIVGITQRGFHGTELRNPTQFWMPEVVQQRLPGEFGERQVRDDQWLWSFGRLRPGATFGAAKAEVEGIGAALEKQYRKTNKDTGATISTGFGLQPGDRRDLSHFTAILMSAVGLVLLLACANIAGLMTARSASRRREIAVRLALGASGARVVRQLLTESVLLATIGGTVGLLMSYWFAAALTPLLPKMRSGMPFDAEPDWRVLMFTLLLSFATGVLFGLAPAWQSRVRDLVAGLKDSSMQAGRSRSWMRSALVVSEVAFSLVLLLGAGLLLRSLRGLRAVDPGFTSRHLVLASLNPSLDGYDEARARAFYEQLMENLRALPGVSAVTIARSAPLQPGGWGVGFRTAPGEVGEPESIQFNTVEPNYFDMMGIVMARGRKFGPQDTATAPLAVIINETAAQRYWPGQDPIGKQIYSYQGTTPRTIVGIVRDVKYRTLTEKPRPYLYAPMSQPMPIPAAEATVHVFTTLPAAMVGQQIKQAVRRIGGELPVFDIRTLDDQFEYSWWQQRMAATLIGIFAVVALALAAIGVYGLISMHVSERTRELGIRMALGARRGDIVRLVLWRGVLLGIGGVLLGAIGGLVATRALQSLLFGVSPSDPVTLVWAALLLACVAVAASLVPACRAIRVDPMVVLRYE